MGISGLLPFLRPCTDKIFLAQYAGFTIGVDAYVLLHRGIWTCVEKLVEGRPPTELVRYFMNQITWFQELGLTPFVVFDGAPIPAKLRTESARAADREMHRLRAQQAASRNDRKRARGEWAQSIDITPEIALQALRAAGVLYLVAPYEADAQLVYLERIGLVDAILSEDSDMLVFGCRTLLCKLDRTNGTVERIQRRAFDRKTSPIAGWSDAKFRSLAILSGCDYLSNIPDIALKTIYPLLKTHDTWQAVLNQLGSLVPKGYVDGYLRAENCFLFQHVYEPIDGKLVHLNQPRFRKCPPDLPISAGRYLPPETAREVADGILHPASLLPMLDIDPGHSNNLSLLDVSESDFIWTANTTSHTPSSLPPLATVVRRCHQPVPIVESPAFRHLTDMIISFGLPVANIPPMVMSTRVCPSEWCSSMFSSLSWRDRLEHLGACWDGQSPEFVEQMCDQMMERWVQDYHQRVDHRFGTLRPGQSEEVQPCAHCCVFPQRANCDTCRVRCACFVYDPPIPVVVRHPDPSCTNYFATLCEALGFFNVNWSDATARILIIPSAEDYPQLVVDARQRGIKILRPSWVQRCASSHALVEPTLEERIF
ncbi:PIN domain-like protein [Mycena sanguinolenta]|uniref:PIN domain-like protein n=1 Tax=Mycena sanguinolenta TaxID=230812 RepID=A0A8H7CX13_9AGAR|nr:PIN domain-like protein [Mycena sanguinolenta]